MAISTTINYDNSANFTFDSNKVEFVSSKAQLKLETAAFNFIEAYTSDTGFTYDNTKAEFSGGQVQQKDQIPEGTLHSNFNTDENATWARGSSTGTLVNGATVSSGVLNLPASGTNAAYVQYDGTSNMPSGNTGCVRFTFTPNYSGSPGSNRYLFASSQAENDIDNFVRIMHIGTNLRIDIYNSSGASIHTSQTGNTFNPTAGTPYEIELNWDATAGEHRLFINGVLTGGLKSGTGTIGARGIIRVGKDYTSSTSNAGVNGTIDNLIIFDAVQHTANYTPGASITESIYVSSNVTVPTDTHSALGTIQALTGFTTTEGGAPRYTLQLGSGSFMYYTGSADRS